MSLLSIKKRLKDAGIKASVERLSVPKDRRTPYSCQYKIIYPQINGEGYSDEVIDKYDAYCRIEDYLIYQREGEKIKSLPKTASNVT